MEWKGSRCVSCCRCDARGHDIFHKNPGNCEILHQRYPSNLSGEDLKLTLNDILGLPVGFGSEEVDRTVDSGRYGRGTEFVTCPMSQISTSFVSGVAAELLTLSEKKLSARSSVWSVVGSICSSVARAAEVED